MYSCADCGTCRSFCVTDQPLPEAIAAVRAEIVQKKLAPPVVYELEEALKQWGNPYQKQAPQAAQGKGEVALFVGDDAKYVWPVALEAALKLLAAVGVHPVLIGVGRNSGYLASSLGLPETAIALANDTLQELRASGASRLLVLSPGDQFTFTQLYDERLGIEWPKNVVVQEVIPFLAEQLEAGHLKLERSNSNVPYTYLDPTHTVRVKARVDAPRKLLAAVMSQPGREVFWRQERAHACGDTALQFTNPPISRHLTYARLGDAAEAGARKVITEDPGCLKQLSQYAASFGLEVQGLYELLAEHLG
jgi:Fe-S oxidoreductase